MGENSLRINPVGLPNKNNELKTSATKRNLNSYMLKFEHKIKCAPKKRTRFWRETSTQPNRKERREREKKKKKAKMNYHEPSCFTDAFCNHTSYYFQLNDQAEINILQQAA